MCIRDRYLNVGKSLDVLVKYSVTDFLGLTDNNEFIITITGTNDRPNATYSTSITVVEDNSITGQLTFTDIDDTNVTFALTNGPITGLTINPNGSFTFNATQTYQYLNVGDKLEIPVQYSVTDVLGLSHNGSFSICLLYTSPSPRDRG